MNLLDLIILSAVVYRATRFVQLDSMFEGTRDQVWTWFGDRAKIARWRITELLWEKLLDGSTCAFCVSVWLAGAAVPLYALASDYELAWVSFFHWLAVATGAMVFYRYIDPPE